MLFGYAVPSCFEKGVAIVCLRVHICYDETHYIIGHSIANSGFLNMLGYMSTISAYTSSTSLKPAAADKLLLQKQRIEAVDKQCQLDGWNERQITHVSLTM